ncbi:MAG: BMP family ABC transporter substrate-binding protein [Rubellimicrobium sp.]|nr:BMP family ABC transporter substrate-binding protein [Rubellimicrobium sp.]
MKSILPILSALGVIAAVPAIGQQAPVALVIAQGGLGDGSWNDTANAGFQAGLEATGLEGRAIESNDVVAQGEEMLRRTAEAGFGLVIDLEYSHGDAMEALAPDYPDTGWVIFNQTRPGANIASVVFAEHEGSFLAGALAAQVTVDTAIPGINAEPILGVVAALRSPGIDKFTVGFIQGARAINPDIVVNVVYADSFGDPAKGQQMAQALFDDGADIVYHVAGGTGLGVIEAARASGHYAIGVDTDQDSLAPGNVLTSMVKRVDLATRTLIEQYAAGQFPAGTVIDMGLAQGGVGLSDMTHTRDLIPAAYLERVEALRAEIVSGGIEVWDVSTQGYPDFFQ